MSVRKRTSSRGSRQDEIEDGREKVFAMSATNSGELYVDVYKWPNGDMYQGQWCNELMHGRGAFTWANGDKYVGDWERGKMHGRGKKFQLESGVLEEGTYIENSLVGPVKRTMQASGDTFVGLSTGFGEYIWMSDQYKYCGMWKNDTMHGAGHWFPIEQLSSLHSSSVLTDSLMTELSANQVADRSFGSEPRWIRSHKGMYCMGVREGYGLAELLDGSEYQGNWSNDLFNGPGHLQYSSLDADGNPMQAEIREPTLHTNLVDAFTELRRCNHVILAYEGNFVDGHLHGRGCLFQEVANLPLKVEGEVSGNERAYRMLLSIEANHQLSLLGGYLAFDADIISEILSERDQEGEAEGSGGTYWSVHKLASIYYGFCYHGAFNMGEASGAGVVTNKFLPHVRVFVERHDGRWFVIS